MKAAKQIKRKVKPLTKQRAAAIIRAARARQRKTMAQAEREIDKR